MDRLTSESGEDEPQRADPGYPEPEGFAESVPISHRWELFEPSATQANLPDLPSGRNLKVRRISRPPQPERSGFTGPQLGAAGVISAGAAVAMALIGVLADISSVTGVAVVLAVVAVTLTVVGYRRYSSGPDS